MHEASKPNAMCYTVMMTTKKIKCQLKHYVSVEVILFY